MARNNFAQMSGRVKPSKSTVRTNQSEPIKGREDEMVANHAGGYSFATDSWARLDRFLILGASGNTMYLSQKTLVTENADLIEQLLAEDGLRVVEAAANVLRESRSMKTDAPFFALAMAASSKDDATRAAALAAVPSTIRIPTHLFTFVGFVNDMRGWGRALRRSVGAYYSTTALPKLAMHSWKYKSRDGWSHRDVLRLAHVEPDTEARNHVLNYMVTGKAPEGVRDDRALEQIAAAEQLLHTSDVKTAVGLIREHRLTREAVPTALLNETKVWDALLEEMPVNAMVRNLGKMSSLGMTGPISDAEHLIVERLTDAERVQRSRMHPMNVLVALKTYESGQGLRGNLSWKANRNIVDALEETFELAFGNVEKTGKRILLAGDDSGSMGGGYFSSSRVMGVLSPAEAAAAMMYITYKVEPKTVMISYSGDITEIKASRRTTMSSLLKQFGHGGATNTALPLHYALEQKIDFDAIVSYTDNETWAGNSGYGYYGSRYKTRSGHVTEVLRDYQRQVGHPVRFLNVAMVANGVTDVDPTNANMFEIAGMDSQTPQIISEFVAGRI